MWFDFKSKESLITRLRLHKRQKSLTPLTIFFYLIMMGSDIRGWIGLKFFRHLSYSWGKVTKNLNQENWPDRGSNPDPLLGERQPCYHSTTADRMKRQNTVMITSPREYHHYHRCSAQGQVLHCKCRNLGCSSVQRQVFHRKLRNQGCSFTGDWIDTVTSHCFPHPTFSLASEQN